jgi:hypothetical protein
MLTTDDERGAVANEVTGGEGADRGAPAEAAGTGSIDKVRDILFGSQVREFERRFARLEERIAREASDLKEAMKTRLDALELYVKKETESLAEQMRAEHEDRIEADGNLSREAKDAARSLERRTTALDDQLSKSQRELRQLLLEQHQRLTDDLRRKTDEVLAALAREAQELRNDKADRATIASLLTEMAMRLTNEFRMPSVEDAGNG